MKKPRIYYRWHGEPVQVEFGYCNVKQDTERPFMWYNFEVYNSKDPNGVASIQAVRITTADGQVFCIANHFGIGAHKLRRGGWPDCAHFSLPVESFKPNDKGEAFCGEEWKRLREEEYAAHEAERGKWEMHVVAPNNTEQWAKMRACREIIRKSRIV